MSQTSPQEVTRLLQKWRKGDDDALAKLMPVVCDELRIMARRYLANEDRGHTLQPTALVNEVYLKLHGCQKVTWQNRAHFFGFAAQTMRRVLVDHARGYRTQKRGDGFRPLPLDKAMLHSAERDVDLLALDDALDDLARIDPRQARIVELKYFVGLKISEIAEVLEISAITVKREWKTARMWLYREISNRD